MSTTITRRHFLRNTAATGAVGAIIAAPAAVEAALPESPAMDCWNTLIASLGDRVPDGSRVQIFGNSSAARAVIMKTGIEQVRPNLALPVERIVASYRLRPEGWFSEDIYHLGAKS